MANAKLRRTTFNACMLFGQTCGRARCIEKVHHCTSGLVWTSFSSVALNDRQPGTHSTLPPFPLWLLIINIVLETLLPHVRIQPRRESPFYKEIFCSPTTKRSTFLKACLLVWTCVCVSVHMKKCIQPECIFRQDAESACRRRRLSSRRRAVELNWTDQTKLRWLLSIRRDGLGYGSDQVGRRSGEGIGYSHSRSLVCLVDLFVCRWLLAASTYELHRRWMQFPIYGCILMQFFFIISEGIEVAPFSVNSLPAIRRVWTSTSWELCSHSAWRCDVSVCTCMQLYNGICNCKEPRGKKNASCIFAGDVIAHAVCLARFTCQGLLLLMLFLRSNNEWISCWLCLIRTRNSGIVKPIIKKTRCISNKKCDGLEFCSKDM